MMFEPSTCPENRKRYITPHCPRLALADARHHVL